VSRSPERPHIDVIVPFLGSDAELRALRERLRALELRPGDNLLVVDNRPRAHAAPPDQSVVRAPDRQSSYHARNRGAAEGEAPWLVFVDADVLPSPELLDQYFSGGVDERTAVLAGAIQDVPGSGIAGRYAQLARSLSDDNVWRPGFPYAQTASAAVRREAFESVGGFDEVRSGGDADLCFRLARAGWRIERRPGARVQHRGRSSLRALLRQYLRYGAGAAWLEARHPGFAPRRRARDVVREVLLGELAAVRALGRRDADEALRLGLGSICSAAFEVGRRLPNDASRRRPALGRSLRRIRAR
jgi:GT2 family glycosyltransferase